MLKAFIKLSKQRMQILSYLKLKYEQQKATGQLTYRVGECAKKII